MSGKWLFLNEILKRDCCAFEPQDRCSLDLIAILPVPWTTLLIYLPSALVPPAQNSPDTTCLLTQEHSLGDLIKRCMQSLLEILEQTID